MWSDTIQNNRVNNAEDKHKGVLVQQPKAHPKLECRHKCKSEPKQQHKHQDEHDIFVCWAALSKLNLKQVHATPPHGWFWSSTLTSRCSPTTPPDHHQRWVIKRLRFINKCCRSLGIRTAVEMQNCNHVLALHAYKHALREVLHYHTG